MSSNNNAQSPRERRRERRQQDSPGTGGNTSAALSTTTKRKIFSSFKPKVLAGLAVPPKSNAPRALAPKPPVQARPSTGLRPGENQPLARKGRAGIQQSAPPLRPLRPPFTRTPHLSIDKRRISIDIPSDPVDHPASPIDLSTPPPPPRTKIEPRPAATSILPFRASSTETLRSTSSTAPSPSTRHPRDPLISGRGFIAPKGSMEQIHRSPSSVSSPSPARPSAPSSRPGPAIIDVDSPPPSTYVLRASPTPMDLPPLRKQKSGLGRIREESLREASTSSSPHLPDRPCAVCGTMLRRAAARYRRCARCRKAHKENRTRMNFESMSKRIAQDSDDAEVVELVGGDSRVYPSRKAKGKKRAAKSELLFETETDTNSEVEPPAKRRRTSVPAILDLLRGAVEQKLASGLPRRKTFAPESTEHQTADALILALRHVIGVVRDEPHMGFEFDGNFGIIPDRHVKPEGHALLVARTIRAMDTKSLRWSAATVKMGDDRVVRARMKCLCRQLQPGGSKDALPDGPRGIVEISVSEDKSHPVPQIIGQRIRVRIDHPDCNL